jgi:hypothetical protein
MKQYRITTDSFDTQQSQIPDAFLDGRDLAEIQKLAGIPSLAITNTFESNEGSNISKTANEKAEYMKKHNIQPGSPEWFRLWFTKPYLTNTKPY